MKKILVSGMLVVVVLTSAAWGAVGGGNIVFELTKAANVTYSHDDHVTKHKLKCGDCHYRIYTTVAHRKDVTMTEMQKGQSCGACHNGQRAFDVNGACDRCHI